LLVNEVVAVDAVLLSPMPYTLLIFFSFL